MSKFCGILGFIATEEVQPGVWVSGEPIERRYYGDINRDFRRWDKSESVNDNLTVSNTFSVLADSYLRNNTHALRYIKFSGSKWKISSIEIAYPRLRLTLGGLYTDGE